MARELPKLVFIPIEYPNPWTEVGVICDNLPRFLESTEVIRFIQDHGHTALRGRLVQWLETDEEKHRLEWVNGLGEGPRLH